MNSFWCRIICAVCVFLLIYLQEENFISCDNLDIDLSFKKANLLMVQGIKTGSPLSTNTTADVKTSLGTIEAIKTIYENIYKPGNGTLIYEKDLSEKFGRLVKTCLSVSTFPAKYVQFNHYRIQTCALRMRRTFSLLLNKYFTF